MTVYTIASIEQALLENADWIEAASVAKAQAFVTAAARWLSVTPQASSDQGTSLSWSPAEVRQLRTEALNYIKQNAGGGAGSVRHLGIGGSFRR